MAIFGHFWPFWGFLGIFGGVKIAQICAFFWVQKHENIFLCRIKIFLEKLKKMGLSEQFYAEKLASYISGVFWGLRKKIFIFLRNII